MKMTLCTAFATLLFLASAVEAGGHSYWGHSGYGHSGYGHSGYGYSAPGGYECDPCVKVEDRHHIHPCAVPMTIRVPVGKVCGPCGERINVSRDVTICAPPGCHPPKIKRSLFGNKVTYDFGKYEVECFFPSGSGQN